jgi:hypothetical protein
MQKKTFALGIIILAIALITACKKTTTASKSGNVQHALTDTFYYRALFDTTWVYHGDANRDECQSGNSVCSSFLYDATFTLSDSANPHPHDSIIRGWVGKTFLTTSAAHHPYAFSFVTPDSSGRLRSTDYTNNASSSLMVTSVEPNGVSTYTLDSAGAGYKCYKVKGTFYANVARSNDSIVTHITQGVFSINVMESTQP